MQENESLRDFMKLFGQAMLQSAMMDGLFKWANKYFMLEDDVHAATQQVLVTNRPTKHDKTRNSKPLNQLRQASKRQDGGLSQSRQIRLNGIKTKGAPIIRIMAIPLSNVGSWTLETMGYSPSTLENPRRLLSKFNGATTTSQGDVVLPVQAGPVTLNVQFLVVEDLSYFFVLSMYHEMVSYLTEKGQVDLLGSHLAACQCYQVALDSKHLANEEAHPNHQT
ncbi:hypothetical protein AAG906_039550 [Vitis piasezkii]